MRFAILLLLLGTACGPKATSVVDAGTDVAGCLGDPRVATYAAGMSVTSTSGGLHFTLEKSDPAPPVRGINTWTLHVTDEQGAKVNGLDLRASAFMPDHGHGSSAAPEVTAQADGTYRVTPLYFFMPGVWRITLATVTDAGASDSAQFFFCIEG
jgi:hypothetical protein